MTRVRIAQAIGALAAATAAGCSFNAGGIAGDDPSADASGGDDVAVDAAPGSPDARRPDAAPPPPDAPPPLPPGTVVAQPVVGAVTLDGDDAEFDAAGVTWTVLAIEDGEGFDAVATYAPSSTVRFAALHDADHVYLYAAVTDDTITVDSTSLWADDGVAFYLDVAHDASGPFDADDHELVVRSDGTWADYGPVGTSAALTVAAVNTAGGYAVEVQITKASLSSTVGGAIGFDVGLTDDDGIGSAGHDAFSFWYRSARPECADCCLSEEAAQPWCDTTLYGQLLLP